MGKSNRKRRPAPALLPALLGLIGFLVVTFGVAYWASQYMPGEWYTSLVKPSWTPPSWLFGPVWSGLYLCMALAAWLVWRNYGWRGARMALDLYVLQLIANGAWTWIFFGRHEIGLATLEIGILLLLILATMLMFWRRSTAAGLLFLPYFLWVAYASTLTFAIWRLN